MQNKGAGEQNKENQRSKEQRMQNSYSRKSFSMCSEDELVESNWCVCLSVKKQE